MDQITIIHRGKHISILSGTSKAIIPGLRCNGTSSLIPTGISEEMSKAMYSLRTISQRAGCIMQSYIATGEIDDRGQAAIDIITKNYDQPTIKDLVQKIIGPTRSDIKKKKTRAYTHNSNLVSEKFGRYQ